MQSSMGLFAQQSAGNSFDPIPDRKVTEPAAQANLALNVHAHALLGGTAGMARLTS